MTDLLLRLNGNGKAKRWIKRHIDYADRDWCLLWPFSRIQSGYAGFGKPWTGSMQVYGLRQRQFLDGLASAGLKVVHRTPGARQ